MQKNQQKSVNCFVKEEELGLAFVIDKLTNSIENVLTGECFKTEVQKVERKDLKGITKKFGWAFDWKAELTIPNRDVYKLIKNEEGAIVQGLVSLEDQFDHVYMHLIESAPFNRGRSKLYRGVSGNLVAFACLQSFKQGFEGYLSFLAKTRLMQHYKDSLGAKLIGGQKMMVETPAAKILVDKYYKDEII